VTLFREWVSKVRSLLSFDCHIQVLYELVFSCGLTVYARFNNCETEVNWVNRLLRTLIERERERKQLNTEPLSQFLDDKCSCENMNINGFCGDALNIEYYKLREKDSRIKALPLRMAVIQLLWACSRWQM